MVLDEQDRAKSPTYQREAKEKRDEKLKALMDARAADKLMFQDLQTNDYDPRLAKTMTGTHLEEAMV